MKKQYKKSIVHSCDGAGGRSSFLNYNDDNGTIFLIGEKKIAHIQHRCSVSEDIACILYYNVYLVVINEVFGNCYCGYDDPFDFIKLVESH